MEISMFKTIHNIEDVIKSFEGRSEFTIGKRDGFTVIDYNYILPDTFSDSLRLEGRGIKFNSDTGEIIARPFHKFFNLNERPETQFSNLPWNLPYVIQEKFDGSMIHPAIIKNELVLMTRKGISDVAIQAMSECLTKDLTQEMKDIIHYGYTPIYEYTSPNNRIVIEYDKPKLRLLALRNMKTGVYSTNSNQLEGIKGSNLDPITIVNQTRSAKGSEGVVIFWPLTGHRVKLKSEEYVSLHRAIDTLATEKRILDVILDNKDDDLCSMISEDRAEKVREYAAEVRQIMSNVQNTVVRWVDNHKDLEQKEFALKVNSEHNPFRRYASEMFAYRSGKLNAGDIGKQYISRHTRTQSELDTNRDILGIRKLGNLAFNTGDI